MGLALLFGDTNWVGSLVLAVLGAVALILPFRGPRTAVPEDDATSARSW